MKIIFGILWLALYTSFAAAAEKVALPIPQNLTCTQVLAIYGPYAKDRLTTDSVVKMSAKKILYANKGSLDNEVVITLGVDGEVVTDLIFLAEDISDFNTGKIPKIRGQFRESSSRDDTWITALTVVDCQ